MKTATWQSGCLLLLVLSLSPMAYAQTRRIKQLYPGCADKKDMDSVVKLLSHADKEALGKFLYAKVPSGACTVFEKGEEVHFADWKIGFIKVRRPGDVTEYWTISEVVSNYGE